MDNIDINLFLVILDHFDDFRNIVKFEILSKNIKDSIRNYNWMHVMPVYNYKNNFIFDRYKFRKIKISNSNLGIKGFSDCKGYHHMIEIKIGINSDNHPIWKIMDIIKDFHTVDLSHQYVTDIIIENFINCHTLDLSHSYITDECVKKLTNCKVLNLSQCWNLSDDGIKELGNCTSLNLSNTHIKGTCFSYLQSCKEIIINDCYYIDKDFLIYDNIITKRNSYILNNININNNHGFDLIIMIIPLTFIIAIFAMIIKMISK